MGTRTRAFIAVAPAACHLLNADVLRQLDADVRSDERGGLVTFTENFTPLHFRFNGTGGGARVRDLQLEVALYEWLGQVGSYNFRFVRGDERLEQAGDVDARPWFDDEDVRELEHQVLTLVGPEYTRARGADFAARLTFEQFQRTGREVDDLRTLPGAKDVEGFGDPWGGRAYGGTPELEAAFHLFASGPDWIVEIEAEDGEDMELADAERALYERYLAARGT